MNNMLTLELANFSPMFRVAALPSSRLDWDAPCTGFSVSVTNPTDYTSQFISSVAGISDSQFVSALNTFTAGARSPTPAGGVSWTQTFTVNANSFIRSPANFAPVGGGLSIGVSFNVTSDAGEALYGDNPEAFPDAVVVSWSNPRNQIDVANLTGNTFLQSYASTPYTVSVTGMSSAANYSHSVTGNGGTVSNASGSGVLTFTDPIHKDNADAERTVATLTAFTRPAAVTGNSYTINRYASSSSPEASFTYPSFRLFTPGLSVVPSRSTIVTGSGFQPSVTVLGDQARTLSGYITNSSPFPQVLWFGVRSSAPQPTIFQAGASPSLLSPVTPTMGNTVDLQPDSPPAGYSAVGYTLYGITLQAGSTFVNFA